LTAQCLVDGPNIQYTPNPSNTIVNNGTEYVKLYIHVCERFQSDPTVSNAEVAALVQMTNSDFLSAGIEFFYCLERHFDPEFISSDVVYTSFTHTPEPNYNPNLNNIMAYTNYYSCSPIFTPSQNTRMMETLQNNPLLQGFRFKFIGSNLTINGNETWPLPGFPPSGNAYIDGNLTISPNAQLTINSGRIQFSPTAKVFVQPRGKLILRGTLTSWCDYWQVVEVQGNAGVPQSVLTHGMFQSGKNANQENARVENAMIGVFGLNGGIVDCISLTLSNNNLGSAIGAYGFAQPLPG
jgi:hypothetical protein